MVVWFGGGVVERYDGAWEHTEQSLQLFFAWKIIATPNHGDMISYSTVRFSVVGFDGVSICWVCVVWNRKCCIVHEGENCCNYLGSERMMHNNLSTSLYLFTFNIHIYNLKHAVEHKISLESPCNPNVLEHLGIHPRLEPPLNHSRSLANIHCSLITSPI